MSNLAKLEFVALDISGKNYLSILLDAEIHLDAKGLGDTIKKDNKASSQDKAKVMIFLRHHLHEGLKGEYLTVKDPEILWNNLKDRYDHQKNVILPKACYDWLNLRLQDFKSVSEYNSTMFKITLQLELCGEKITDSEMLKKTYSTFHANNVLLQTQYREKGFTKYYELIFCLLVAEQNNELLIKNHESRPIGSTPFPKANVMTFNEPKNKEHVNSYGRGRGRSSGRGRRRGRGSGYRYGHGRGDQFKNAHSHRKWEKDGNKNEKNKSNNTINICYRYSGKGHWSRVCCTPKHIVELYQQSLKGKGKTEINFVYEDGEDDLLDNEATHLKATDFFTPHEGDV